ncbi:response regulator transcription factor [Acetomicrobium sp.]|uniref:response regulator transcription factor n=1 Tax=Acetomicrobium sp. TaxID=1872099 RepID=UPI001BCDF2A6|nr:response regulator transcription factor [Acetomicrobium sp.]
MSGEKILLVEDEENIASLVSQYLSMQGYEIIKAADGDRALEICYESLPDLIILDLMLPIMDGWEVCRRLKKDPITKDIPIIILTARRDERDVIEGLELGADDYVKKPFSLAELHARIKTILRRAHPASPQNETIKLGKLELIADSDILTYEDIKIELTPIETELIKILMKNAPKIVSREQLLAKVWGTYLGETRTIDVHICRLRTKAKKAGLNFNLIETVRHRGYRLGGGINDEKH